MRQFINFLDGINRVVGESVAWLALYMVLVQFIVVVMRYVFGVGSIFLQESIIYMHAMLFMFGAGYTLLKDGHVRVDVFYREATPRTQAIVDLFGAVCFLIPVTLTIFSISWSYVTDSWSVLEGSKETSGIHAVYILKTVIPIFCVLVILQGVSMIGKSLLVLRGFDLNKG
ncbi:MAG: TRAP transporter small permease subunit [Alphaproteobacteria bacterium]